MFKFKKLHLSTQFAIVFAITAILLLISISIFSYNTQQAFQDASVQYSNQIIAQFEETVNTNYTAIKNILYFFSFQKDIQDFLVSQDNMSKYDNFIKMRQNLISGISLNSHILDVALVDENGEAYFLNNPTFFLPEIEKNNRQVELSKVLETNEGFKYFALSTNIYNIYSQTSSSTPIGTLHLILDTDTFLSNENGLYNTLQTKLYLHDKNDKIFWSNFKTDELTIKNLSGPADKKIYLPDIGLYITALVETEQNFNSIYNVQTTFFTVLILIILLLIAIFVLYIRNLLRMLQKLYAFINKIRKGNLHNLKQNIQLDGCYEVTIIGDEFSEMLLRIDTLTRQIIITTSQLYEAQLAKSAAELQFMRSQINPHFLYNTLDSITGLAAQKSQPEIVKLTKSLSSIFKYSIKGSSSVTLETELKIIKSYVSIQLVRFPQRFTIEYNIPADIMEFIVPKMILQPLVENAIIHGIENYDKIAKLSIDAKLKGDDNSCLEITIFNDGIPIEKEKLKQIQENLKANNVNNNGGIGIYNVNNRLNLLYGKDFGLELESSENGTFATITLVAQKN